MIQSVDIDGINYDVDEPTYKYVMKKIAKLDRFLPRRLRESAVADVKLRYVNRSYGNKYEAEVILTVPERKIMAKDSTFNMMAAIDIVEAKLVNQLSKYKA